MKWFWKFAKKKKIKKNFTQNLTLKAATAVVLNEKN